MKEQNRNFYVRQIMGMLKQYIPNLILAVLVKTVNLMMPYLVVIVVGKFIDGVCGGSDISVAAYGVYFLAIVAGTVLFSYLDTYVSHDMSFRIVRKLRTICFEKIERILPASSGNKSIGDYGRIVNGDVDVFEWFYAHIFVAWCATAVSMAVGCMLIAGLHMVGLPILVVCTVLVITIPKIHTKAAEEKGYALRQFGGELNAVIVDGILGMKDIISNQFTQGYHKNLTDKSRQFDKAREKYNHMGMNEKRITSFIIDAAILMAAWLAFCCHSMGIGEKFIFVMFVSCFFGPLEQALRDGTNYGFVFGAARRVYGLLQEEEYVQDTGTLTAQDVVCAACGRDWELDIGDVAFSYPNARKSVLKGVTFTVRQGKTVALAASSGGGKTTLANLLQRFWDYREGSIRINGIDIRSLKLSELRKLVTVVSQDIYLFNMSVEKNLLMAKPEASKEEIMDACIRAGAWEFIEKLPHGLETKIGERGESLSGGQRQRIALAQAFLKDAPVLILDEATSNLDIMHEKQINKAVDDVKGEKLVLVIAHRLHTIRSADRVVFLQDGVQVACGEYDRLLRDCGAFRKLVGKDMERKAV